MIKAKEKPETKTYYQTPFGKYITYLDRVDQNKKDEYGSILILSLVEEIGEMSRAYLAEHGRKPTNLAAQEDETYEQELGDIIVAIMRFARIKNIDLDKRIMYSLKKIKKRRTQPKRSAKEGQAVDSPHSDGTI